MKSNWSLKIISLLFAIIMWFYIIEVQSPEVERTIKDVPVMFTYVETLENRDLMLVNDKDYKVDIKVRGQRKYVVDVTSENLSVSADVSKIESTGTYSIFTNVVVPYGNIEVVSQKPSTVTITVDEIVEDKKNVVVRTVGNTAKGYTKGEIKVSPEKVKVRGAKSIVGAVDHLLVTLDISDKNQDISSVEKFQIIGTSDTVIESRYVTCERDSVEVYCEILKTKTVPVKPRFSEEVVSEGKYELDNSSVKSIEVAGTASLIEKLDNIDTKVITLDMINEDGEVEVELVLPTGVESLDGDKLTLKLKKVKE